MKLTYKGITISGGRMPHIIKVYQRNDLVEEIATGRRGAVLSCSHTEVIVLMTHGDTKIFKLEEVRPA